jgi:hypothetical protein
VLTIEAEDALIAALKAKHEHPEAVITYVRESQSARRPPPPPWRLVGQRQNWYRRADSNPGPTD